MQTPSDYAHCSLQELYDKGRHINREQHPEAYAALLREIAKREQQPPTKSPAERIANFRRRLFTVPTTPRSAFDALIWWEQRRIPYNLIVGMVGLCSLPLFFFSIVSTGTLRPGEDAVEPLALLFAPVALNICYCAGWLGECILRAIWPAKRQAFGPVLFKLGLAFSLFVATFPALFWFDYRLLQLVGILK